MPQKTPTLPEADGDSRIDRNWDDEFNNAIGNNYDPKTIRDLENEYDSGLNANKEAADGNSGNASGELGERESTPGGDAGWKNNVSNNTSGPGIGSAKGGRFSGLLKGLRRFGPAGSVVGILAAIGIGGAVLLSPAMLLNHLKEVIVDRFNLYGTSLDVRTDKILRSKITGTATTGACTGVVKISCKYNRMSNRMLQRLADNSGLVALDKDGKKLNIRDGKWGTTKPYQFGIDPEKSTLKLPDGSKSITAKDLPGFIKDNPEVAKAFRYAYNPRWVTFWDKVFNDFFKKFGGSKAQVIKGEKEDEVKKNITENNDAGDKEKGSAKNKDKTADKNASQADKDAIDAANKTGDGRASDTNALIDESATAKTAAEVKSKLKGRLEGGVFAVFGLYCLATRDAPKISKAIRLIQAFQLMKVASDIVLQPGDVIKGQAMTPAVASGIASTLSTSLLDANGKVVKKSALESDGMLYALEGNTKWTTKDASGLPNIYNYIPAGGFMQQILAVTKDVPRNGGTDTACDIMGSEIGTGVQLIANFTVANAIMTLVTEAITRSPQFEDLMSNIFKQLAGQIVNSATSNEDLGNALGVGGALVMSEAGNAGGTMPLTPDQAVAYSQLTSERRLANAKIDQAEYSPFDISKPNTMMGSIFTKAIPYIGMVRSSPVGTLGAVSSIVSSTFSTMFAPSTYAAASLTAEDFTRCPDVGITSQKIAAGPVCDVQYGIPVNYLTGIEPSENMDTLFAAGYIDDQGAVKPNTPLEKYLKDCVQGEETLSDGCKIENSSNKKDEEQRARFALYAIDSRIQTTMDEDLPEPSGSPGDTTASSPGDNTTCSANTIDMGQYDNAHDNGKKTSIHLCAVPNLPGRGYAAVTTYQSIKAVDPSKQAEATGKAIVNARASGATFDMVEAAKKEGVNLTLGGNFAFRSFEHQVQLRQEWCASGDCDGAAVPGTSNHEMGLAIDFGLPGKPHSAIRTSSKELQWLRANAEKFGFKDTAMPKEDWHWKYVK